MPMYERMKPLFYSITFRQDTGLRYCCPTIDMSHLVDGVWASGSRCMVCGGCGGTLISSERSEHIRWHNAGCECALPVWARRSISLPWRRVEDNAPFQRHDCEDVKHCRAISTKPSQTARRGRLAPPAVPSMPPCRWWYLSISVSSDASNEALYVKNCQYSE